LHFFAAAAAAAACITPLTSVAEIAIDPFKYVNLLVYVAGQNNFISVANFDTRNARFRYSSN
jgi:hypothetical protein